ncbi:hypothetical protein [Pseudomonas costantinii]|uniref:hypothetical protein n=1 Tax=Pseudomonas costantinii TaxID=168469 RepID=UPI00159FDCF4|nr:hypothetical protein [Pseudomonas costantinii]NVZ68763.1 hypothetical protein [Pseudomonas costantinii]
MSFFNAIANFKIALIEALVGNNLPHKGIETAKPLASGYGKPGHHHHHHHRPHSSQPGFNYPQPTQPVYGKPHPHPVSEHQLPSQPLYPICSLSR